MSLLDLLEELKKEIKDYNYETLTGGDDTVAARCLEKAEIWLRSKLRTYGVQVDLNHPVIRLALLKRALYELYSFAENEEIARDKARDAIELLRAEFGRAIEGEGEKAKGDPVVSVMQGQTDWKGF